MTYFVIIVSLIFLGVTLFIDIFKWFINDRYWEGLKVVPMLLMANVFLGIYYNQSIWYKLANKTKFGAYIAIGGAFITLSLNFALIPYYGYVGSAWATLIVYFLMMVASHILGQKYYPIKYNLRKVVTFLILAVSLFFIDKVVQIENSILRYGLKTFLVFIFIGIVVFIENPISGLKRKK
jgi:O-antigen/teichoic acid export membrane protein